MNFRLPYPNVFSSVPDLVLGLAFLATWIDPASLGDDMVSSLSQVMLLEFIIIHSSGFMGAVIYGNEPRGKKILYLAGLGFLYMLFVFGFAFGFRSWWPVIAFSGLMFNRMLGVLTGQAVQGTESEYVKQMWGVNVAFYLVSVFIAILVPFPELGVSAADLAHLNMSGDFIDHPEKMMVWGFLYFTAVGYFELKGKTSVIKVNP